MPYKVFVIVQFLLFAATDADSRDGDIRLVGGSYQWEGRVEIYFSGTWGTISDSEWSSDDAQAACRKLGYFKPGATGQPGAYFGQGSGPIHLDYVLCSGTEYNLTDCETGNRTRLSSHSEDVGVKCQTIDSSYREGDIRLVRGYYNWEGRVEIFRSETWSTIYDTIWTYADARVVCRQLGHSTEGATPRCCGYYGEGSGLIRVRSVSCSGSETNITECSYSSLIEINHQYDVGVQCQQGGDYKEGDIRLVGGSYSWQGRVEIYLYGEWGTISYPHTDPKDAHVVCQQLGYDTTYGYIDLHYSNTPFGRGTGPIHMNRLGCSGSEYRLKDCYYENSTYSHYYDWSVTCRNDGPSSGDVRLFYYSYYNTNHYYGIVEVYLSDEWGTVANDGSWSIEDGQVVCRQLGFDISSIEITLSAYYSTYDRETAPVHMSNVECSGNESRLIDCPHSSGGNGSGATLRCNYYNDGRCRFGSIRLTGGETETEGRVEVCDGLSRWGTVCNKQWTSAHTKVVCRGLGYSDTEGFYHSFGGWAIPISMDFVNCNGSEHRLLDCPHFTHSYGCSHSDDAGVRCQPAQCDDGDVRLIQGISEREGRVEVCINKKWGTICRSGWSAVDAATVCRQLGYSDGITAYFPNGVGAIHIILVDCSGVELQLFDCRYDLTDATTNSYCYGDAGVTCTASCSDGEVRLVEGESEWEGRLEVCFSRRWGTVGSDGWTQTNAQVVCNDLGYESDSGPDYSPLRPATNSMHIYMKNVHCSGGELTLLDCSYKRNLSTNDHSKDLGIKCKKASCNDGNLRLVGGDSEYEGVLEICFGQRWGTVNGDGWTSTDTQVACRQMGFETTGYSRSVLKSILSAPIFIDNVACYGNEDKLIDCTYHTDTSEDDHSDDIWLDCENSTTTSTVSTTTESSGQAGSPATDQKEQSISTLSIVALVVALIAVGISVLVIIGFVCKKRKLSNTRVHYQKDKDEHITVMTIQTSKSTEQGVTKVGTGGYTESPYPYQPLTAGPMQKGGAYQEWGVSKSGGVNRSGSGTQPHVSAEEDENIYDSCT